MSVAVPSLRTPPVAGPGRLGRGAAVGALLVTTILAVATIAVTATRPHVGLIAGHTVEGLLDALVFGALGAVLVRRVPGNHIGALFCVIGASEGVATFAGTYAVGGLPTGWPLVTFAAWIAGWVWILSVAPVLTLLLLVFPDGVAPSTRWRPVTVATVVVIALYALALATSPRIGITPTVEVPNALGLRWSGAFVALLSVSAGPVLLLACPAALVVRLRRADAERRAQLLPFVAAVVAVVLGNVVTIAVPRLEAAVELVTFPLVGVAAALCVLRRGLYELDIVVRRSLVYGALTALVVLGYVVLVQAAAALLHHNPGLPGNLVATAVIAAVFAPTRAWLQDVVVRLLYGQRRDPVAALTGLAGRLQVTADPASALREAVDLIADALRVPWVAVSPVAGESPAAASGERPGWLADDAVISLPLRHGGATVGTLLVAPRSPRESLHRTDRELLSQLAGSVSATVAAHQLTTDLRASRERLVLNREDERRRLRHDLHDGVGPHLAALGVLTDLARRQLDRPELAARTLAELRRTTDDVLADLRRAVEDLRPAAVDELGLGGALEAHLHQLARRTDSGAMISVDATGQPLPAALEVAAFRIAVEAATNALRHTRARHVTVDVAPADGALVIEVVDDGGGFNEARTRPGVGLTSMRARAEELGGSFAVSPSGAGGTRVLAVLPHPALRAPVGGLEHS